MSVNHLQSAATNLQKINVYNCTQYKSFAKYCSCNSIILQELIALISLITYVHTNKYLKLPQKMANFNVSNHVTTSGLHL